MCGILAIQSFTTPQKINEILKASDKLKVRGPDSRKAIVKQSGIYVFHRRSINDLSTLGDQPFTHGKNEEVLLMCNGQIYNHEALQKEHGITCTSKSDCEVILHLYLKFGFEKTIEMLDGVFAIVLVDKDVMYVARDRIGVRPLFIGITVPEKYVSVASTPDVLQDFCINIRPVLPNSITSFTKMPTGESRISCFPTTLFPSLEKKIDEEKYVSIEDYAVKLNSLLTKAVEKRLMSDRKVACFLSGGLDSTIVVYLMVKEMVKRGFSPKDVRTYSIGMEGSTDLHYAKIVSKALGTSHTELIFTEEYGLKIIPEVINVLATNDITTIRASVGMYILSKYIAENTDDIVILSGEGSDEELFGYLYFHKAPTPQDAQQESLRLLASLHLYDVLRGDRCVSSNGLEIRVPFLDKDVVDFVVSIPPIYKMPIKGCEKWILRKAFESDFFMYNDAKVFIPREVLLRQKTAFSDGVSSVKKSWFQVIKEYTNEKIPDEIYSTKFPSKEAFYYYLVFKKFYPMYETYTPYWLPKWCGDNPDPSARTLTICTEEDV